jgi:hypothetical protein
VAVLDPDPDPDPELVMVPLFVVPLDPPLGVVVPEAAFAEFADPDEPVVEPPVPVPLVPLLPAEPLVLVVLPAGPLVSGSLVPPEDVSVLLPSELVPVLLSLADEDPLTPGPMLGSSAESSTGAWV